jgi:hypothetical protein
MGKKTSLNAWAQQSIEHFTFEIAARVKGKGVRQTVKGFLSGARKMVCPREDETFLLGVLLAGADGVSH